MKELDCAPMKEGAKVVIIQELPSDSDIMHVVKVRVFGVPGRGSTVGYTVNIGLE